MLEAATPCSRRLEDSKSVVYIDQPVSSAYLLQEGLKAASSGPAQYKWDFNVENNISIAVIHCLCQVMMAIGCSIRPCRVTHNQ